MLYMYAMPLLKDQYCNLHLHFTFILLYDLHFQMYTFSSTIYVSILQSEYQKKLQEICDKSLSDIVTLLHIDTIVAIGKYAEKRSNEVVKNFKLNNIKVKLEN